MTRKRTWRRRVGGLSVASVALAGIAIPAAQADPENPVLSDAAELTAEAESTVGFTGKWFVELSEDPTIEGGSATKIARQQKTLRDSVSDDVDVTSSFSTVWNGVTVKADQEGLASVLANKDVVAVYPVVEVERPVSTLDGGTADTDMFTAGNLTGANVAQEDFGLTGKGIKIGIIDTGVDLDHPAFGGTGVPGTTPFPSARVIAGYDFVGDDFNMSMTDDSYNPVPTPDNNPDDCATGEHGTHVAGIAAANDATTGLKGVAPEARIGAYRVFGCEGSTDSDIMLQAMERASKDGMDVVNMSIGASFQTWPNYPTAVAANAMVASGIVVTVSQGNSGERGIFSGSAPAVAENVIAVGSVNNTHIRQLSFNDSAGNAVPFLNATGTPGAPDSGTLELAAYPEGQKTGAVDLEGTPFEGKAVLISRGTSTFYDKAIAAENDGAAAVIIYNNQAGTISATAAGIPAVTIPTVTITQAEGLRLEEGLADGSITSITWTSQYVSSPDPSGGVVSDFSSYGLSATLETKPDVLAPGGNIFSSYPLESEGGYATISGTSMAAPHVAGAAALLLESNPTLNPVDVRTILQNTAQPLDFDVNTERGITADDNAKEPVHRQGAGLIDLPAAIVQAHSYQDLDSEAVPSTVFPSKISLGDTDENPATTLTITNRSSEPITYTLSSDVSPAATTGPNSDPFTLAGLNTSVTFSADEITVPAHSTGTVDVTIEAPTQYTSGGVAYDLPWATIYGGYVVLTSSNDVVQHIPFTGLNADYESLDFMYSTWTYGDLYPQSLLATYGIDPATKLFADPALGNVSQCPNGRVIDNECADEDARFGRIYDADHVYTMEGYDIPRILVHLEHPVSELAMRVYTVNADGTKGEPVTDYNYAYRSNGEGADTGIHLFSWNGTLPESATSADRVRVADGRYILEITLTKGTGKSQTGDNTEVYTSLPFFIGEVSDARTATIYSDWQSSDATTSAIADGEVLIGDWNGDGNDTFATRNGNTFEIDGQTFRFGRDTDKVLVGDWNGDGKDTPAVVRGNIVHVKNALEGGAADMSFGYGRDSDVLVAGDWNGDGKDSIAAIRGNRILARDTLGAGPATSSLYFGRASDEFFVGDWDGDGKDGIAARRGATYFLNNSVADQTYVTRATFGTADDLVLVGDWDGNGTDTPAVLSK